MAPLPLSARHPAWISRHADPYAARPTVDADTQIAPICCHSQPNWGDRNRVPYRRICTSPPTNSNHSATSSFGPPYVLTWLRWLS